MSLNDVEPVGEPSHHVLFVKVYWLCDEIIQGFKQTGAQVAVLNRNDAQFVGKLVEQVCSARPDFVFSLNFQPVLARLCHQLQVPYVAWNIDNIANSSFCDPKDVYPETLLFSIDQPGLEHYRAHGYPHLFHLPYGANEQHFVPAEGPAAYACEVSFVGCSMIREGNEYGRILAGFRKKAQAAQSAADQAGFSLVADVLEQLVERSMDDCFSCDIEAMLTSVNAQLGFDLARMVWGDPAFFHLIPAKEVSSRKRIALIQALSPMVDVFGDPEWLQTGIQPSRFHPRTDYYQQTPDIYRTSKINLNIEKVYNTSSINPRVVDAMMCGGFVLTERTDEVATAFQPDRELVLFDSLPELQEKVRYYLDHEQERKQIAMQGCAAVRSRQTLKQQLLKLLQCFDEWRCRA